MVVVSRFTDEWSLELDLMIFEMGSPEVKPPRLTAHCQGWPDNEERKPRIKLCLWLTAHFLVPILIFTSLSASLFAQEDSSKVDYLGSSSDFLVASNSGAGSDSSYESNATPQGPPPNRYKNPSDWWIGIYPVFAWTPILGVSTREFPSVPGGGGTGSFLPPGHTSGSFNGAVFAGFRIEKSKWSADATGLWAGLSGERTNPFVHVGV